MIAWDIVLITGALALVCVAHWRAGVIVTLLFGLGLDPLRKLVPGEPLFLSVLVFALVGATLLGARLRGVQLTLRPLFARGSLACRRMTCTGRCDATVLGSPYSGPFNRRRRPGIFMLTTA